MPGPGAYMFLHRLRHRRRQPELMDQPGLDARAHHAALRALKRINWLSGSAGILWRPIRDLARAGPGRPLRLLDVATGAGDVPLRLWRKARRAGIPLEVAGCDVSPVSVDFAQRQAERQQAAVSFFEGDACRGDLPVDYDVMTCSLFLHHLDQEQALALLRALGRQTRQLVLVNDLNRSRAGYLLAWAGSRLLTRSRIVHVDGPRSVEGAFTIAEAKGLAEEAGLGGAQVESRWPCRWLLSWRRS